MLFERPGRIYRVQVRGGRPIEITTVRTRTPNVNWGPDDTIVYDSGGQVLSSSLVGGEPKIVLSSGSVYYDDPFLTKDGRTLLVSNYGEDQITIGVFDYPEGTERGQLELEGRHARYRQSGHLLIEVDGNLFSAPVDLQQVRVFRPASTCGREDA